MGKWKFSDFNFEWVKSYNYWKVEDRSDSCTPICSQRRNKNGRLLLKGLCTYDWKEQKRVHSITLHRTPPSSPSPPPQPHHLIGRDGRVTWKWLLAPWPIPHTRAWAEVQHNACNIPVLHIIHHSSKLCAQHCLCTINLKLTEKSNCICTTCKLSENDI